jgi:hypothetical protein
LPVVNVSVVDVVLVTVAATPLHVTVGLIGRFVPLIVQDHPPAGAVMGANCGNMLVKIGAAVEPKIE